jgi:hypothetical protein
MVPHPPPHTAVYIQLFPSVKVIITLIWEPVSASNQVVQVSSATTSIENVRPLRGFRHSSTTYRRAPVHQSTNKCQSLKSKLIQILSFISLLVRTNGLLTR